MLIWIFSNKSGIIGSRRCEGIRIHLNDDFTLTVSFDNGEKRVYDLPAALAIFNSAARKELQDEASKSDLHGRNHNGEQ